MTTITINENVNFEKTEFEDLQDLFNYLIEKEPFNVLLPLDENDVTPEREERFQRAINTPKSELLNI